MKSSVVAEKANEAAPGAGGARPDQPPPATAASHPCPPQPLRTPTPPTPRAQPHPHPDQHVAPRGRILLDETRRGGVPLLYKAQREKGWALQSAQRAEVSVGGGGLGRYLFTREREDVHEAGLPPSSVRVLRGPCGDRRGAAWQIKLCAPRERLRLVLTRVRLLPALPLTRRSALPAAPPAKL